jgi:arylamine N-acetyltransferase
MELNAIFGTLLRSIGFTLYATGARVHDGKEFGGWYAVLSFQSPSLTTT